MELYWESSKLESVELTFSNTHNSYILFSELSIAMGYLADSLLSKND